MRPPKNFDDRVHLSVQLPESTVARLEATAFREGVRLPAMILAILELGLDTHNGQEVRRAA
ncbi:MAG: hypothetical protein O3C65_09115 [Proteobacteria bacterium]|nr:hypothetical protein [Pseudomonadota bacterium]MDA1058833.1 hypothetical protein [Pseudomonadota bacterium]